MLKIIAGVLKPDAGKIIYNETDITALKDAYREILGYLPQNPGLYPFFTGKELLFYFARLKQQKIDEQGVRELLSLVHLEDCMDQKVGEYSGGMKRRIGIAVTLLNHPKILVLDEPTAGLDPKERMHFRSIVNTIRGESIILVATHIVSDIEHIADSVILMDHGEVEAADSYTEILQKIKGKVWVLSTEFREARVYMERYRVVTIRNTDKEHVTIRIISDICPSPGAKEVYPSLEDVYMCYLGGE